MSCSACPKWPMFQSKSPPHLNSQRGLTGWNSLPGSCHPPTEGDAKLTASGELSQLRACDARFSLLRVGGCECVRVCVSVCVSVRV